MEVMAHIKLQDTLGIPYVLLPGDPGRVERIAAHLSEVVKLADNREFKSIRGSYRGVPVLVTSTGIGGPSTAIAVEELFRCGVKYAVRIGSCGALDAKIGLGDLILAQAAVRDDGTSRTYIDERFPAVADFSLLTECIRAAEEQKARHFVGLVRSHDSFYTDKEEEIDRYWASQGVLGADMETAALFTVGRLRGMAAASILNNVVEYEGSLENSINEYTNGTQQMMVGESLAIQTALEAFYSLNQKKEKRDL